MMCEGGCVKGVCMCEGGCVKVCACVREGV